MLRKKVWQRGSADLVSVAVGMTILAIVTGGTAAAMVMGRELTAHEEHYKTAAYALRGVLEQAQTELQYVDEARSRENLNATRIYARQALDVASDISGVKVVLATLSRDRIDAIDLPETGAGDDYYIITVRASWIERNGMPQNLAFRTAIFAQRAL
jgi:type II secretory pathway component PulK